MKILKFIFFVNIFLSNQAAWAKNQELLPDRDGARNYLIDDSTKKIFADAFKFKVITNFVHPTKEGAKSAISAYYISCRMQRLGYLDWRTYSRPWAKGRIISIDNSRHFEQIEGDPRNLEMQKIICG
jgi:hypothetical protein